MKWARTWRVKVTRNPRGSSLAAVGVILLFGLLAGWRGMHSRSRLIYTSVPFMDIETKEIQLEEPDALPPLVGKLGRPTLVRAGFFTCDGDCSHKKLVFLERWTNKAREILQKAKDDPNNGAVAEQAQRIMDSGKGLLVRKPEGTEQDWVPATSAAGRAIYAVLDCGAGKGDPKPCNE